MTKGERIKHRREQLGISQTELTECIGTSKQNLYKYENDIITNIPSDRVEALAKKLNTSPAYIMGWNEDTSLPSPTITKNLTADEANAFFQYLSGMGYFVRYDEERMGYHVISEDRSLDLFLSPEVFKRTARTSGGMIKGMLESMKHQQ